MSQPNKVVKEFRNNVDILAGDTSHDQEPFSSLSIYAKERTHSGVIYSHIQPGQGHTLGLYIPDRNLDTWAVMSEPTEVAPKYIGRLCLSSSDKDSSKIFRSIRIRGFIGEIDDIDITSALDAEDMQLGLEWMTSPVLRHDALSRLMMLGEVEIERIDAEKAHQRILEKELREKFLVSDDENPGFFDDNHRDIILKG